VARSLRTSILAVLFLVALRASAQERVTLPAAASLQGIAPFFSDVRAFNTSYASDLEVQLRYRCFLGPCPAIAPGATFTLGPRESLALDDIVVDTFHAPDTGGGVEFEHGGAAGQLVVTSRLYSTAPTPTVGMFVPGLPLSDAHDRTVLTSIRNGGSGQGFRTNVGVFNPGDAPLLVGFTILDATGMPQGSTVLRDVAARSGVQVNAIFAAAGIPDVQTDNAAITAVATSPVFAYAAVIDNETTDPIFVVGSRDVLPGTPTITRTPTITHTPTITFTPSVTFTPSTTPTITQTFTPTSTGTITETFTPTSTGTITQTFTPSLTRTFVTRTPTTNPNQIVSVGVLVNGFPSFVDSISGNTTTTINVGRTVQWNWVQGAGLHSTTSGSCVPAPCTKDFIWDSGNHNPPFIYTHTFNEVGTFPYYCMIHGEMMTGAINVLPPGSLGR
jgi:hypothetical protein